MDKQEFEQIKNCYNECKGEAPHCVDCSHSEYCNQIKNYRKTLELKGKSTIDDKAPKPPQLQALFVRWAKSKGGGLTEIELNDLLELCHWALTESNDASMQMWGGIIQMQIIHHRDLGKVVKDEPTETH